MKVILFILSFSDIRLEYLQICPIGLVSAVKVQVQSIFPSLLLFSFLFFFSTTEHSIPFTYMGRGLYSINYKLSDSDCE